MANSTGNNPCKKCPRAAVTMVKEERHGTTTVYFLCGKHAAQRLVNEANR